MTATGVETWLIIGANVVTILGAFIAWSWRVGGKLSALTVQVTHIGNDLDKLLASKDREHAELRQGQRDIEQKVDNHIAAHYPGRRH